MNTEQLVEDLVDGKSIRIGQRDFCLSDLFKNQPLIDSDATLARLISADRNERLEILDVAKKQARSLAKSWLDTAQGQAVIKLQREKDLEERESDLEYELRSVKSIESMEGGRHNPIGISCGCVFDRDTESFQKECDKHAEQDCIDQRRWRTK